MEITAALRSKARDADKRGVVKVQLATTAEKIEMLRAKKKCDNHEDTTDVIIRACESHDARVGRLNSKLLLSLLPKGKEYYITGHGVIRKKENTTEDGGIRDAPAAESEEVEEDEAPPAEEGDNKGACAKSGINKPDGSRTEAERRRKNGGNPRSSSGARSQSPRPAAKKPDMSNNTKSRGGANGREEKTPRASNRLKKNPPKK